MTGATQPIVRMAAMGGFLPFTGTRSSGKVAPIPDLPSSPRNGEVRTRGCVRTPYPDENEQFHCSGSRAAEFFALP